MTATLFRYLNEQGYKFSMITTEISSHVPMGENTITNIMKVSVAGTSLKESEKNVCES